jgi:transcription elongation GreA/GreB family factor
LPEGSNVVLPLPAVALTASDYPRLEKLARDTAEQGDMDAMFLLVEINRADIIADDDRDVDSLVTVGSWVTYWTNWGVPRKTVQLVWPEDRSSDLAHVSVLSGLGAALLGLKVGDQMPYFIAGCMNVVRIERVTRESSKPLPLHRSARARIADDDDDHGPTAA